MANTEETPFTGTVVEVSDDDGATWEKFVCNEGAFDIDWGTADESEFTCLETGVTKTIFGANKFSDQTFDYTWTQALTNGADEIIKAAKASGAEFKARITMANKTDSETSGTTYEIPFRVKAYAHKGEQNGKWTTETIWKQNDYPVETPATA
ncbi:MAG: hypothetical protein DRO01_05790 [Thermoproteota archaeon]|nr:MAG: hypothetical protein DRO01_05790 [Candidatus Korarchaeota archaeon]